VHPPQHRLASVLSLLGPIAIHALTPQPLLVLASVPEPLESLVDRALLFRVVPVTCVKVCRSVLEQPFASDVRDGSDELGNRIVRYALDTQMYNHLRYRSSGRIRCISPTQERYPDLWIDAVEQSEQEEISTTRNPGIAKAEHTWLSLTVV
jgi:hypothetical protein